MAVTNKDISKVGDTKGNVTFCSWNVKGVNEAVKRSKVLSHLKSLKADIIFLQETHLKDNFHNKLRCRWVNKIFHSNFSAKARGVCILIKKGIPFQQTSTIADKNGRYIIVSGELYGNLTILLNIYGPNFDDPEFYRKVFALIPDNPDANLIIGGDLNLALDNYLDKSTSRNLKTCKAGEFIKIYMSNSNLLDIWRTLNPSGREYSFHSHVHNTYTRIDYFIIDGRMLPNVKCATYHNIIISDHCPVTFNVRICNQTRSEKYWRFDSTLLNDVKFRKYLDIETSLFFDMNDQVDTAPSLLWETYKAYIRGSIISFQAAQKKRYRAEQTKLENEINKLEADNAQSPSNKKYNSICALKYKLNQILTMNTNRAFMYMKQKYFEFGDKPQKLLARQLKKQETDRTIYKIKDPNGSIQTSHKEINENFMQFYASLYTSKSTDNPKMETFLDQCELPLLNQKERSCLNTKITLNEIKKAIMSLKSGKSPGPDGLGNELYKHLKDKLAPYLLKMYEHAYNEKSLPPSLNEAIITVLPKKDRDLELVTSYRPISLLNSDQKILAKILAMRLSAFMNQLVHSDQTGFIPQRCSLNNIRRLLNIIYSPNNQQELMILGLDAEKAFDQVEWPYLFAVLEKYQLGEYFISWIRLLYKSPTATIFTNHTRSRQFKLGRGTRQGCVLSPLLFALALEPLAETIRKHPQIYGYDTAFTKNKISLFADDILLYITRPQSTIPKILSVINEFGLFSGYRINWEKSELMPVKINSSNWLETVPFKIAHEKITYLGIVITKKYSSLIKENVDPLTSKLKDNIQFWKTLPISLVGRINAVKMVFLPQYLYIIQNLPVFLTKSFFKKLDGIIIPFIWNFKKARIKKTHLIKNRSVGGLALPNFIHYYWATTLRSMSLLLDDTALLPPGLLMEYEDCLPLSVGAIVLSPTAVPKTLYNNNPLIHSTIKVYKQMVKNFKLKPLSLCTPIAANPSFPPSCTDGAFNIWREAGLLSINELYSNNTFMTFKQLQDKYNIPSSHFYRYLQIRNYVRSHLPHFQTVKPDILDECLSERYGPQLKISEIYNSLEKIIIPSTTHIKREWEREIGTTVDDDLWHQALGKIKTTSINTRHCLIQYKIVHRLHYSREKLHKIYPETSPTCEKCNVETGTLLHSFATCPKLQTFWINIFEYLSTILKTKITPNPILIIFGITYQMGNLDPAKLSLISYSLITAKKLILQFWKGKDTPSLKLWITELTNTLHLEKIRFTINDKLSEFDQVWQPLISFLKEN